MNCSSCRTDLPVGAAYCPLCGTATLHALSNDPTAAADRAPVYQATTNQNSPPFEGAQQNPYQSLPPYPSLQVPPPPPYRRLSALLAGVLALLLIAGSGGIYYTVVFRASQVQARETATAQEYSTATMRVQQATATAFANTPQGIYNNITSQKPVLDDPLSQNDGNTWDESQAATYGCAFTEGSYHASLQKQGNITACVAYATHFDNFAFQVQMVMLSGDSGGLLFRFDSTQFNGYSFTISQSGTYVLSLVKGSTAQSLVSGPSSSIKTGPYQVNLIAVVALGNQISLYVNNQFVARTSENTFHDGQIGMQATENSHPTEVAFQHAKVWHV